MAELSQLSNTLSTQDSVQPSEPQLAGVVAPVLQPEQAPAPAAAPAPALLNPDGTPIKRKPGRPKGSGKKPVDPNAPPKIKRPVGRPRKDGLPAGSVGPRRPSSRTRKRPPGKFAADGSGEPAGQVSWAAPWSGGPAQTTDTPSFQNESISAAPASSLQPQFAITPSAENAEWLELSRSNPNGLISALTVALAAPNPVSSMGQSVEDTFASHLKSLAPSTSGGSTIPTLYSILKTFWLPTSPAYFALTASASTARTPSEHRFLYWDPQPLVFNGIACPYCATPLVNKGRIASGPVKVYDLGRPFFVIACEYSCKASPQCAHAGPDGRRFSSVDQSILRALPEKLREEFPAHLMHSGTDVGVGANVWNWQAMGVSRELMNLTRGALRLGIGRDAIVQMIRGVQCGVPDEPAPVKAEKQEEEEEDADDGPSTRTDGEAEVEAVLQQEEDESATYASAWKANDGATDNQAGPSSAVESEEASPAAAPPQQPAAPVYAPPPPGQPAPVVQYAYAGYPPPWTYPPQAYPAQPYAPPPAAEPASGAKRSFSVAAEGAFDGSGEPVQKRTRHCCKCGSQDCKGKGGRNFCTNPCQDCGKMDCKGRNSKRPDKTCTDAWV